MGLITDSMPTNFLNNLAQFISNWDAQYIGPTESNNDVSERGEINIGGSPESNRATVFTKQDALFWTNIEKGVRPLVQCLIERLDCITYSSCEGHRPCQGFSHRIRHVGIVPRDSEEYFALLNTLRNAANRVDLGKQFSCVELVIKEDILESEHYKLPCIDVLFCSAVTTIDDYFDQLDQITASLIEELRHCSLSKT